MWETHHHDDEYVLQSEKCKVQIHVKDLLIHSSLMLKAFSAKKNAFKSLKLLKFYDGLNFFSFENSSNTFNESFWNLNPNENCENLKAFGEIAIYFTPISHSHFSQKAIFHRNGKLNFCLRQKINLNEI